MGKLKQNYIFDLLNNVTSLIFPLITFPYVTRVLSPDGIGIVNFCQSVIMYIVMLSALGIPTYATKEVSKLREDKRQLSKFTIEILSLHFLFSLLGYLIAFILLFVPTISIVEKTYLIASIHIILNLFGLTWFYQGIEEFRYITVRALFFRVVSLVLLFVIVNDPSDVNMYMLVIILSEAGNNICNLFRIRKYISLRNVNYQELQFKKHLRPIACFFLISISTMIYFNTDNIMIGFIKDTQAVGYYTPALKIQRLSMSIILSIGTILFPRLSSLIFEDKEKFIQLCRKGVTLTIGIGMPIFASIILLSDNLILFFAGTDFEPSILTLRILSPVILLGCCSNVLAKILISQNAENVVLKSTSIGAVVNILLNGVLIFFFSQNGAAAASVISEISVLLAMALLGKTWLPSGWLTANVYKYVASTIIMVGVLVLLPVNKVGNIIIELFIYGVIGVFLYSICLFVLKESDIIPYFKKIVKGHVGCY